MATLVYCIIDRSVQARLNEEQSQGRVSQMGQKSNAVKVEWRQQDSCQQHTG